MALLFSDWSWIYQYESKHDNLIPLRHIMLEVSSVFWMKCDSYNSYTTTFEDNTGEIDLEK